MDKWMYEGLDPILPRMVSEHGPFLNPFSKEPFSTKIFKMILGGAIRGKHGTYGFGKKEACHHNPFIDLFFDPNEKDEEGLDLADYRLSDDDVAILAMPKKQSMVPCKIKSTDNGLFAMSPEPIDERCFVIGEDHKICSASFDPRGTDEIKIIPSVSFMSWIRPMAGIEPRFSVKCVCGTIDIEDKKRNREYVTVAQTDDPESESSSMLSALNLFGLSSIVGKYPLRRKQSEDNGS